MSQAISQHGVKLTDQAVDKVRALLEAEGRDDLRLRIAVEPGGFPICTTQSLYLLILLWCVREAA